MRTLKQVEQDLFSTKCFYLNIVVRRSFTHEDTESILLTKRETRAVCSPWVFRALQAYSPSSACSTAVKVNTLPLITALGLILFPGPPGKIIFKKTTQIYILSLHQWENNKSIGGPTGRTDPLNGRIWVAGHCTAKLSSLALLDSQCGRADGSHRLGPLSSYKRQNSKTTNWRNLPRGAVWAFLVVLLWQSLWRRKKVARSHWWGLRAYCCL